MFSSCSCEVSCRWSPPVSKFSRSNSNHVSRLGCALGSRMNTSSLLSMPFSGMFRSTPPGIDAFTNAPNDEAAFAAAEFACEAALDAVFAAVFTALFTVEVLRLANQSNAPISNTASTTGHNHFGVPTVRASSSICDARDVTLESPGIEKPEGRKLRKLGSSEVNKLPSPLAVSPWLLTFDARVPSTIGAAEARMLPADEERIALAP